jgi:hypothetical protein
VNKLTIGKHEDGKQTKSEKKKFGNRMNERKRET